MLSWWTPLLWLSLTSSVTVSIGEQSNKTPGLDREVWIHTKPSVKLHESGLKPTHAFGEKTVSSEDRHGVLGEYSDLDELFTASPFIQEGIQQEEDTDLVMASSEQPLDKLAATYTWSPAPSPNGSVKYSTESLLDERTAPGQVNSTLLSSNQNLSTGDSNATGLNMSVNSHSVVTDATVRHVDSQQTDDKEDDQQDHESTPQHNNTLNTTSTPCRTNQTWTPSYPEDSVPHENLRQSFALSSALFIPLYSDWNSALATWGFAWEAHIYGLGSVFTGFGLISVVCLLGLPFRCPPGSAYFTLLHLLLLAFVGIQAFCLLYDAYYHQERLPSLPSLLLSQLPFPCLSSSFSVAFLLLSLRSRKRLSLPLAISSSFSALPKPCLLLLMSLLHFTVALVCVGLLLFFHTLPSKILLLPQGVFVCLTVYLSTSYLIYYCLVQIDTKHIYRLNDSGESGGSPEIVPPVSCPFANAEDWGRAAGAGVSASLCFLGCGGFQLYGILHALGLGGVEGNGFLPWAWWGLQVGCRLCEAGVCLSLSLIGTHPLFCQKSSRKDKPVPRPGSWSRLSHSSPSRGISLPSPGGLDSPIHSSHLDTWSPGKQKKLVLCEVITNGQSESLPLFHTSGNAQTAQQLPVPHIPATPVSGGKHAASSQHSQWISLGLEMDSTVDLRPPSPIDLSRSIDQALFSESLFSHSIFGLPRLSYASSSHSLTSISQSTSKQGSKTEEDSLYRTSSCGDMDQDNNKRSCSRSHHPQGSLATQRKQPLAPDWKGSGSGSTVGLCSKPSQTRKLRSNSWTNRGQRVAQNSLPRAIPHLSYYRRYRTLSSASQDSQRSRRLASTKQLSESKQLEWDLAVQAEFVNVCRQIDALSVCSDTIDL
ncbi:proline-rich transmembrane protein 4 [Synchiropus splendidus]|uniref:proline-rich transmembrane protein 4 n=1 Tax=Synchiropus splendidus TaxID=270530 RepID=UPI00237DBC9F|nr:proline-rich transmembrane protein 4 [Synchiropus splendidus]